MNVIHRALRPNCCAYKAQFVRTTSHDWLVGGLAVWAWKAAAVAALAKGYKGGCWIWLAQVAFGFVMSRDLSSGSDEKSICGLAV